MIDYFKRVSSHETFFGSRDMLLQRVHFLTLEFIETCQATHRKTCIHVFDMCAQMPVLWNFTSKTIYTHSDDVNKPQICDKCAHEGAELNLHYKAAPFQARFPPCCVAQGRTGLEGLIVGGLNLRGGANLKRFRNFGDHLFADVVFGLGKGDKNGYLK